MKGASMLSPLARILVFVATLHAIVGSSDAAWAQAKIFEFYGDNPAAGNGVGASAAVGLFNMSDTYPDLVIGAPGFNASAGAVYVLEGPLNNATVAWTRLPSVAAANGRLGTSVAYSPTFRSGQSVFVVGAPYAQGVLGNPGIQHGRAFEYYEDTALQSVLLAPALLEGTDRFGHAATSCDFNGDGFGDFVIGTDHHVSDAASGKVYVYLGGPAADAAEDLRIYPTYVPSNYSTFGNVLGGIGDINGDGYGDVLIGDSSSNQVFLVYGWPLSQATSTPALLPISGSGGEPDVKTIAFAGVTALTGGCELTGDQNSDIVLAGQQGRVSIFSGPIEMSTILQDQLYVTLTDGSLFGRVLAAGGDVDGDGAADLLIGGRAGVMGTNRGRVTAFIGGQNLAPGQVIDCGVTMPSTRGIWHLSPGWLVNYAEFGASVGFMGDLSGDGRDEIFVGAPGMVNLSAVACGAMYGIDLAQSTITVASAAVPITADPSCTSGHILAVHVDSAMPIRVFANATSVGGPGSIELVDNGSFVGEIANDKIYSGTLTNPISSTGLRLLEVFAAAQDPSQGFSLKNDVHLEVLESEHVAANAEFPLSKATGVQPLIAVRVDDCGGALPVTAVYLQAPFGFFWAGLTLNDSEVDGSGVAGDGVWTYRGTMAPLVVPDIGVYEFTATVVFGTLGVCQEGVLVQVIEPTTVSYVNKSGGTGLDYAGQPYSSVAVDVDAAGPRDLFISFAAAQSALYLCTSWPLAGTPVFAAASTDVTNGPLPEGMLGLAVADYDNDGRQDLFAASQGGGRIYHNQGTPNNPSMADVSGSLISSAVLASSLTGAWGDYDRDGRVDLFVGRGSVSGEPGVDSGTAMSGVLLHNATASGGGFTDVSSASGVDTLPAYCTTATWGDINGDKFPDLFVGDASASGTACRLLRNRKDGVFLDEAASRLGSSLNLVVGASFEDVDADGDLDLAIAATTGALLRVNTNSGTYTTSVPVASSLAVSGLRVFDFDSNGVQDMLLLPASELATPRLFQASSGGGGLAFADVTASVGLNWQGKIGGSVLSDFNNDGDLDMYLGKSVSHGSHFFAAAGVDPSVDAYAQNWLRVTLVSNLGVPNNYMGIGAKVTVTQGTNQFVHIVDGGSGRGGQDDSVLIFGLPSSMPVGLVSVAWPNGYVQETVGPISVGATVSVVDNTQAFLVTQAMGGYQIIPCENLSRWNFTWKTSVGTNPAFDRIVYKINDSNLQNGGTTVFATDAGVSHLVSVNNAGVYEHSISFVVPCSAGRLVYFAATSGAVTETTSLTRSFAESVCSICDPHQQ